MKAEKAMPELDTDEYLMVQMANGQTAAFDVLYDRYAQKMFSYFYRMLWKNNTLAEDQTQELFLKIIKNAASFNPSRSFSTWLYSIANNMCKNEYRKAATKMKYQPHLSAQTTNIAEETADHKKFKEAVTAYVMQLEEDKKALYILRFEEQLSIAEISAIMDIKEGTIKSRIFYLLKNMKEQLNPFKNLLTYP